MLTNKEWCAKNYGRALTKEMMIGMVAKGKLSEVDYSSVTGEAYTGPVYLPSDRAQALEAQIASQDEAILALYEMNGGGING